MKHQTPLTAKLWRWASLVILAAAVLSLGYGLAWVVNHLPPERIQAFLQPPSPAPIPAPTPEEPAVPHALLTRLDRLTAALNEKQQETSEVTQSALAAFNERLVALEGLQGRVGALSQVFLGQQLLLLDNQYRQGGNLLPGIEWITRFAAEEAQNTLVAEALKNLAEATPTTGPITQAELILTAEALYDLPVTPASAETSEAPWWQTLWLAVKNLVRVSEMASQDHDLAWYQAVNQVRFALAHGDAPQALALLAEVPLANHPETEAFAAGVQQFIRQQQALQQVQRAFIESYRP